MASRLVRVNPVTVTEVLDGHVGSSGVSGSGLPERLRAEPAGGWAGGAFWRQHGFPIPSPAILEQIGTAFRRRWTSSPPPTRSRWCGSEVTDRKIEVMRRHLARAATGRSRVAAIGVAQEPRRCSLPPRSSAAKTVWFSFTKADRRVTFYYFYLLDADFGPAFIKVCAYFP